MKSIIVSIILFLFYSSTLCANDSALVKSSTVIHLIPFSGKYYKFTKLKDTDGNIVLRERSYHNGKHETLIKKKVYYDSGEVKYSTKMHRHSEQIYDTGPKTRTYSFETKIYYKSGIIKALGSSNQSLESIHFVKTSSWLYFDENGNFIEIIDHKSFLDLQIKE